MALIRQPESEIYKGTFAEVVLRAGGVDFSARDLRSDRVFLTQDEALQLAKAIYTYFPRES